MKIIYTIDLQMNKDRLIKQIKENKYEELQTLRKCSDGTNDLAVEYERNKKEREMKEEIERLNNIINKGIEYIESYMPNYDFDKTNLIKLLGILKGSDKE